MQGVKGGAFEAGASEAGGLLILPYIQVPFPIVGVGEKSKDTCGEITGVVTCPTDHNHHMKLMYHSCYKWSCPVCYRSTVNRATKRAVERIEAAPKAFKEYQAGKRVTIETEDTNVDGPYWKRKRGTKHSYVTPKIKLPKLKGANHITVSLPESEYHDCLTDDGLKKIKAKALTYAHQVGVLGGMVIFHPYRVKEALQRELSDYLVQLPKSERKGHWDLIHCDVLGLGSWSAYVEFAPHFHIIGYMPEIVEKSNDFFKRTGWVYKNITANSKERKIKSLHGTIFYLLTHAAYIPGKNVVSYFGVCSYNALSVERLKVKETVKCEHCESNLVKTWDFKLNLNNELIEIQARPDWCKDHYVYKVYTKVRLPERALKRYIA